MRVRSTATARSASTWRSRSSSSLRAASVAVTQPSTTMPATANSSKRIRNQSRLGIPLPPGGASRLPSMRGIPIPPRASPWRTPEDSRNPAAKAAAAVTAAHTGGRRAAA